ncbi:hypothetical protein NE237_015656 [Protea cynaroides]|uniref:Uncharacterized protein n=1 Tax=Protea cynaroides TaxID=273540 RepID=A0A9Q0QRA1_9MAGN|nr:hypothetical protein NE237_015656 [Protea cynaroides]
MRMRSTEAEQIKRYQERRIYNPDTVATAKDWHSSGENYSDQSRDRKKTLANIRFKGCLDDRGDELFLPTNRRGPAFPRTLMVEAVALDAVVVLLVLQKLWFCFAASFSTDISPVGFSIHFPFCD